jgi:hypothetical protein
LVGRIYAWLALPAVALRSDPVDARADRAVQTTLAVVSLGAFVFRQDLLIPVLALLTGAGALFGPPGNPLHRVFTMALGPRLKPAPASVPADTVRVQDILAFGLLGVATVTWLIGLGGFAWILTVVEGLAAAVAATTGVHLGATIRDRLSRN